MASTNTNTITETKNGKYLKKTDVNSYVHYQFDTNDGVVYLSDTIGTIEKETTLHEALTTIYELASEGGQAATDLATLEQKVDSLETKHTDDISAVNASIATAKSNLLGTTSDTAGANTIYGANKAAKNAQDKANSAYNLASGLSKAYVFGNASAVYHGRVGGTVDSDGATAGTVIDKDFKIGDSIYVKDKLINDFWISAKRKLVADDTGLLINSIDDIKNATDGAEINVKWTIGREYYYVTLTAVETKANLDGYYDKDYIKNNYLTKETIEKDYVPYSGAKKPVKLGNNVLTVSNGSQTTEISSGRIELRSAATKSVYINVRGIKVGDTIYDYPEGRSSPLATEEFVTDRGYQTVSGVKSVIGTAIGATTGDVTFSGSVDNGITATLSSTKITPGTYSALAVDAKGRATAGYQQIIFALNLDDPNLSKLAINGVAIIDA